MRRGTPIYIAQTQPGFEAIAAEEIADLEDARVRETRAVADKNGMVVFEYAGDPRELLALRTVEDVFEQVLYLTDVPPIYAALRMLGEAVQRTPAITAAVARARTLRPGYGGQGRLRFRVVARQVGQSHFRRVDAQVAVEKAILARTDHRWRREDEGALELWLTLFPGEAILALRLSDEKMRHRSYKIEHLPASLRPSAAAALVYLTRPADDDLFLDPMCGAGTILIERAHAGRYHRLIGGDASREALAIARANIGTRYQPIELHEWDACDLPIDSGTVSAAAVNLPFGRQIGSEADNRTLYPSVLGELARVLRPGARLALLSGDARTLIDALRRTPALHQRSDYPVMLLGRRARLLLVQRV